MIAATPRKRNVLRAGPRAARASSPAPCPTAAHPADESAALTGLIEPAEKEIRNPLSALVAASDILVEELGQDHRCSGVARLIREETARIRDTLADMSALSSPLRLNPNVVNLTKVLRDLIERFRPAADRNGIRLVAQMPEGPLPVRGDAAALRRALGKIVQHAITAMPSGGRLAMTAGRAEPRSGSGARIAFADTGPSVPEALLPAVFDPFFVAPGRRPGMGLALSRRIVEHLGGSVSARNNADSGLTFEVRLASGGDASHDPVIGRD